jgi:hypothetical protein
MKQDTPKNIARKPSAICIIYLGVHVGTICPFRDCWDVAMIDWLNILLLCRTQFSTNAFFSDGKVTTSLDNLRIEGTREFADSQQVQGSCGLDDKHIMKVKRA